MSIEGTEIMGNWGKKIPVNEYVHITQTNDSSREGKGVHITTNILGTQAKAHDYFDAYGNFLGSDFGKR